MKRSAVLTSTLLMMSNAAWAWGDGCDYRADRALDVEASGLKALVVRARAGDLTIEGDRGLARVEARGKACSSDEKLLPEIKLVQRRDGDRLIMEVIVPESNGWFDEQTSLDLVIRMPTNLHVEIEDSSGDVRVNGIASLEADDSSGDLNVRDIGGNVVLSDNSGDLNVQGVGGSVTVHDDNSGDILIRDVRGNALVKEDNSGEILLQHIGGDATVEHDSSGEIEFEHIGGNARVGDDSSGDISARDVALTFTVDSDTSGEIDHHAVLGRVSIPEE